MDSHWSKEMVQELISSYQQKSVLWDPKDPHNFNKLKKNDAWEEIANNVSNSIDMCKKKMEYLLSALRREKQKMKKSRGTGKGADDVYKSTWFAFDSFTFLLDKNNPRQTLSTMATGDEIATGHENEQAPQSPGSSFSERSGITSTPQPTPNNRKRKAVNDDHLDKAFSIIEACSNEQNDECQSFGNFVAMKLRSFTDDERTQLQADITALFVKEKRGFYSQPAMAKPPSILQTSYQRGCFNEPLISTVQPLQSFANISAAASPASDSYSCFRGQLDHYRPAVNRFLTIGVYV